MPYRACLLLILLLSGQPDASAVEFSGGKAGNVALTVAAVDLRTEKLRLFLRNEHGQPFNKLETLANWLESHGQKLVFGMNAGMFNRDFSPVGLYLADGVQTTELNTASGSGNFFLLPNGVFGINAAGAFVVESAAWQQMRAGAVLATQSGPMLVIDGEIHPQFKPDSASRLIRNGVCATSPHRVLFVISNGPLNFYEFARFFRDQLGCRNALYLDGNVSSLYAPALQRNDGMSLLGPLLGVIK